MQLNPSFICRDVGVDCAVSVLPRHQLALPWYATAAVLTWNETPMAMAISFCVAFAASFSPLTFAVFLVLRSDRSLHGPHRIVEYLQQVDSLAFRDFLLSIEQY